jgi:hypothetical protein
MAREDPQLKIRFTPELKNQVEEAARANGRSLNAEVTARLQASFEPTNTERIHELERALALAQLDKSEERTKAAQYASALRIVADRLPPNAFEDKPAIDKMLKALDADRANRVIATLEQIVQDKRDTLSNLHHLADIGAIKIDK